MFFYNSNKTTTQSKLEFDFIVKDGTPEEKEVKLNVEKLSVFYSLEFDFKIFANDFISINLQNLEAIENYIESQVDNIMDYLNLKEENIIKINKIKDVVSHLVDETQTKAVEEEIIKNSKKITNRGFLVKSEFCSLITQSSYILKLIIEKSELYSSSLKSFKE